MWELALIFCSAFRVGNGAAFVAVLGFADITNDFEPKKWCVLFFAGASVADRSPNRISMRT